MFAYLIAGIIALGLVTSYEDITIGKIRNVWTFGAVIYAFLMHILVTYTTQHTYKELLALTSEFAAVILLSAAVGFALWNWGYGRQGTESFLQRSQY